MERDIMVFKNNDCYHCTIANSKVVFHSSVLWNISGDLDNLQKRVMRVKSSPVKSSDNLPASKYV